MVARKKTAKKVQSGNGGAEARALSVVVEEQRAQFKVFGEALQGLREGMDRRFDGVDREIALVKGAVVETNRDMKTLRRAVEDLDARKADRELTPPPTA